MTGRKAKSKMYKCPTHRTSTPEKCVMCSALAAEPKAVPLPSGSLDLDLDTDHAEEEARFDRWRSDEHDDDD
jgi:hypothetical protein